jgi:hypothetical protein
MKNLSFILDISNESDVKLLIEEVTTFDESIITETIQLNNKIERRSISGFSRHPHWENSDYIYLE